MCCSPWDHKESDTTELLNNNKSLQTLYYLSQKYWHHPLPLITFCNLFSVQKLLLLAPPLKYVWNLTTSCELHYWNHFPNNVVSHLSYCNSLLTDFSPPLLPLNTLFSSKQSEEYGRPLNIGVTWCSPSTKLRVYNLEWALCIYSSIYLDSTNWVSCSTVKFTIERNPHINELKQFKHFLFRVTCTLQSQVILNLVLTCYLSR